MANPPEARVDGILCTGPCGLTLRHNTVLNEHGRRRQSPCSPFGTPRDSVIDNNLLAGGGYTVYAGEDNATGIKVTNNRFSRRYYPNGGYWAPRADYANNGTGNIWTGNIWDDTGATVSAP